ncbi:MAG: hypothetical protein ACKO0M_05660 [Cyanobium sp.]
MPSRPLLSSLAWSSSRTSAALTLASMGWMLSGFSPSPWLNGLLPVLVTLTGLLPLPRRIRLGALLQLMALLGLLVLAWLARGPAGPPSPSLAIALTLVAGTIWAVGQACCLPGLRAALLQKQDLQADLLRSGDDIGRLAGTLLTGFLFPMGRALLQFSVAFLLLLPQLPLPAARPSAARPARGHAAVQAPDAATSVSPPPATWSCHRGVLMQGLLFGALFALLPLWVRRLEGGNCFDFGMVLSAYGAGRLLGPWLWGRFRGDGRRQRRHARLQYASMALLLLVGQPLPGWVAVLLFVPFGLLASLSDQALSAAVGEAQEASSLERSAALGALLGSLAMAVLSQLIGLGGALPLQLIAFALMAALLPGRPGPDAARPRSRTA